MNLGVSLKKASTFREKFDAFSEKAFASGDCGALSAAGRGTGSLHATVGGDAHPFKISAEIDRLPASTLKRIERFNQLRMCIPLVFCQLRRGRLLPLLKLGLLAVVRESEARGEAGDACGGSGDFLPIHTPLKKRSASSRRRRVSPGSFFPPA